jgi:hypothetical protein
MRYLLILLLLSSTQVFSQSPEKTRDTTNLLKPDTTLASNLVFRVVNYQFDTVASDLVLTKGKRLVVEKGYQIVQIAVLQDTAKLYKPYRYTETTYLNKRKQVIPPDEVWMSRKIKDKQQGKSAVPPGH